MTLIPVTAPAAEPLSRADAKAFLKVEHTDDDTLIDTLIVAARLTVEAAIRRVLITQTWRLALDGWPPGRIVEIPLSPIASIDTVTVYDADGAPEVLSASAYVTDVSSSPARLLIRDTVSPGAAFNGIEIDFTAGYGAAAAVPAALVQAIRQLVAHWYETRQPVAFGGAGAVVPKTVDALVAPYRVLAL